MSETPPTEAPTGPATDDDEGEARAASTPVRPRAFLSLRARVVLALLLALGVGGFIYAFTGLAPEEEPVATDAAVRFVFPKPGDRVLRQDTLFIELDPDFTGRIETVAGIDVRQEVQFIEGLNRYSYTPDAKSLTGVLKPGRQCASAYFWPLDQPESSGRYFNWCFSVH